MGKRANKWLYQQSEYGKYIFTEMYAYDRTLHEIKNNLKGMGLYSGDTIMYHCGLTIEGLKSRLKGANVNAYEATSYSTYDECIHALSYGLEQTWTTEINPWLQNKKGTKFLTINCDLPEDVIGYGICSDDLDTLRYCHTQCIVLKRSPKNKWGFTIKTAYPTYKTINKVRRYADMIK